MLILKKFQLGRSFMEDGKHKMNLQIYFARTGQTYKEFGEKIGVSVAQVSNYVSGRFFPPYQTICKMLEIGVRPFEIFGDLANIQDEIDAKYLFDAVFTKERFVSEMERKGGYLDYIKNNDDIAKVKIRFEYREDEIVVSKTDKGFYFDFRVKGKK